MICNICQCMKPRSEAFLEKFFWSQGFVHHQVTVQFWQLELLSALMICTAMEGCSVINTPR